MFDKCNSTHVTLFKEKNFIAKYNIFKNSLFDNFFIIYNYLKTLSIYLKINVNYHFIFIFEKLIKTSLIIFFKRFKKFNLNLYTIFLYKFFFLNKKLNEIFFVLKDISFNLLLKFKKTFYNIMKKKNHNFILYNNNVYLIGFVYNSYNGTIIPYYQKKFSWFVGLGLKADGEVCESKLLTKDDELLLSDIVNKFLDNDFKHNNNEDKYTLNAVEYDLENENYYEDESEDEDEESKDFYQTANTFKDIVMLIRNFSNNLKKFQSPHKRIFNFYKQIFLFSRKKRKKTIQKFLINNNINNLKILNFKYCFLKKKNKININNLNLKTHFVEFICLSYYSIINFFNVIYFSFFFKIQHNFFFFLQIFMTINYSNSLIFFYNYLNYIYKNIILEKKNDKSFILLLQIIYHFFFLKNVFIKKKENLILYFNLLIFNKLNKLLNKNSNNIIINDHLRKNVIKIIINNFNKNTFNIDFFKKINNIKFNNKKKKLIQFFFFIIKFNIIYFFKKVNIKSVFIKINLKKSYELIYKKFFFLKIFFLLIYIYLTKKIFFFKFLKNINKKKLMYLINTLFKKKHLKKKIFKCIKKKTKIFKNKKENFCFFLPNFLLLQTMSKMFFFFKLKNYFTNILLYDFRFHILQLETIFQKYDEIIVLFDKYFQYFSFAKIIKSLNFFLFFFFTFTFNNKFILFFNKLRTIFIVKNFTFKYKLYFFLIIKYFLFLKKSQQNCELINYFLEVFFKNFNLINFMFSKIDFSLSSIKIPIDSTYLKFKELLKKKKKEKKIKKIFSSKNYQFYAYVLKNSYYNKYKNKY